MKSPIGESAAGRWGSSCEKMTVDELRGLSVDTGCHLESVRGDLLAEELSYYCFGRTDWGLLVSCFACFWHELRIRKRRVDENVHEAIGSFEVRVDSLKKKRPDKWGDLDKYEAIVASEAFAIYVRTQNIETESTTAPMNLITGFIKEHGSEKQRRCLKPRASDEL